VPRRRRRSRRRRTHEDPARVDRRRVERLVHREPDHGVDRNGDRGDRHRLDDVRIFLVEWHVAEIDRLAVGRDGAATRASLLRAGKNVSISKSPTGIASKWKSPSGAVLAVAAEAPLGAS
jgi:hypothetical protein